MNKTAKNSMIYLMGTIVIALLGFANTMILTRVLSQQVYAMYGLLTNFITTTSMLVSFGYDKAYMRFYYSSGYTRRRFLLKCLTVPACISILVILICLEPSHMLMEYVFGENISFIAIFTVCCYLIVAVLNRFTHLTARMEEHSVNYVVSEIISKSGFVLFVLLLFFSYSDVSFEQIIFSFLLAGSLASMINISILFRINCETLANEKVNHRELLQYGVPLMINNVIVLIIPMIEKIIIRNLTSWEVLGLYSSAAFLQTVMLLLSQTITNIWTPLVYKLCDDESKLKPIIHTFGLACSFLVTICLAFCILARRYIVLLLDEKYYSVFVIAPAILYGACINIVALIYAVGVEIRKKTKILIFLPVMQGIISIALCLAIAPSMGIIGVAIASLVSIFISNGLRICVGLKLYGSGQCEWKSAILICTCVLFAIIALFFSTLKADIIMFVALLGIAIGIVSSELKELADFFISVIINKK